MDSPVFNSLKNVAGYGVGTLAALDTIKSGGLGSYLMNRQRLMSDPGFRASLAGSPFAAGVFGVSGDTGPAPAAPGALPAPAAVAQPSDMVGPPPPGVQIAAPGELPAPSAFNVPGYLPGTPRQWAPNLPPYDPEEALKQQALAATQIAIGAPNPLVSGIAKTQAGMMPTQRETAAVLGQAAEIQRQAGVGSTVGVKLPGMTVQIGSPYNLAPVSTEEFPTYGQAAAAAAARGSGWTVEQTNRGTFKPVQVAPPMTPAAPTPAAPAQPAAPVPAPPGGIAAPPATAPVPVPPGAPRAGVAGPMFAGAVTTTAAPPPTIATRTNNPGNIKDGPFARSQPGYVGTGPPATDGGNFAVFDSPESGHGAMVGLLQQPRYQGLPVGEALNRWSGGGYSGDVAHAAGIDPSRTVADLSEPEVYGLTGAMARREGFQGRLAPRPATAPPAPSPTPPPPPKPVVQTGTPALTAGQVVLPGPPRALPYSGGPFDPNAPAPGSVPARIGYPSAAFAEAPATAPPREPVPEVRPTQPETGIVAPPVAAQPPAPGAAPVAVEPVTAQTAGVPLSRITTTGTAGTTYTYDVGAASELAADMKDAGITDFRTAKADQIAKFNQLRVAREQRSAVSGEDVRRMMRPASAGEASGTGILTHYRTALDKFHEDFPTPADRAPYVGWLRRPAAEWMTYVRDDPKFTLFVTDLSAFQGFDTVKKALADSEVTDLGGTVPTGHEPHATGFEQHLDAFDQAVNEDLAIRLALQQMPVGQQTAAWVNSVRDRFAENRATRKTATALGAMGLEPAPEGTMTVPAATPQAPPPPSAAPTPALPPLVVYGHTPAP